MEEWYSAQPPGLWAKPHFLNTRSSSGVAGRSLPPCGCLYCLSLWRTWHLSGLLPKVTWPVITRPMVTVAQGLLGLANRIVRLKVGCQRWGAGLTEVTIGFLHQKEEGSSTKEADKETLASQVCPGFSAGQPLAERLQLGVEVNLRRHQDASKPAQRLRKFFPLGLLGR